MLEWRNRITSKVKVHDKLVNMAEETLKYDQTQ